MSITDPNLLGANSNTGEAPKSSTNDLLGITDASWSSLNNTHTEKIYGASDAAGKEAKAVLGTDSIFNPFYVFRYAKYGSISGDNYSPEYHKDTQDVVSNVLEAFALTPLDKIKEQKKESENPTAGEIIRWAQSNADQNKGDTTFGAMPYQWNDFLWCKWYGKMPNNRMLTLRRFPIPVEDNLQIAESKAPLVPIAQAVTWWGGDTGNKLSSVLNIDYGYNWIPKTAKMQDVTGNEISADALLDAAGLTQTDNPNLRKILLATLFQNNDNPFAATGYDGKVQNWLTTAYGEEGQYWNRVRGPLNVINSTLIRNTGFTYQHPVTMTFSYKLRSFSNINPRIAMLDLISNFLSLTYSKAEFWGGGIRYFQKTGFILPGMPSQKFENGDFIGGIQDTITYMLGEFQKKGKDLAEGVAALTKGVGDADLTGVANTLGASQTAQNIAGSWVSELMQTPLTMRSFLDGRAVGEWHLTVGNPMNPLAVMGNLCLKSTSMSFNDSLGMDDFPTEVTFKVIFEHGRPRAKQDIESMFNFGGGALTFTPLPQPSSSYNSLGERNSIAANNAINGRSDTTPGSTQSSTATSVGQVFEATSGGTKNSSTGANKERFDQFDDKTKDQIAGYIKSKVARAYGTKFAASPVLVDYFLDLKTKD